MWTSVLSRLEVFNGDLQKFMEQVQRVLEGTCDTRRKEETRNKAMAFLTQSFPTITEECCICMDREPLVKLSPCGHQIMCADCLYQLISREQKTCPFCRSPIEGYLKSRGAEGVSGEYSEYLVTDFRRRQASTIAAPSSQGSSTEASSTRSQRRGADTEAVFSTPTRRRQRVNIEHIFSAPSQMPQDNAAAIFSTQYQISQADTGAISSTQSEIPAANVAPMSFTQSVREQLPMATPSSNETLETQEPQTARLVKRFQSGVSIRDAVLLECGILLFDDMELKIKLFNSWGRLLQKLRAAPFSRMAEIRRGRVALVEGMTRTFLKLLYVSESAMYVQCGYKLQREHSRVAALPNDTLAAAVEGVCSIDILDLTDGCILKSLSTEIPALYMCTSFCGQLLISDGVCRIQKINPRRYQNFGWEYTRSTHVIKEGGQDKLGDIAPLPENAFAFSLGNRLSMSSHDPDTDTGRLRMKCLWRLTAPDDGSLEFVCVRDDTCVCVTSKGIVFILRLFL